MLLTQRHIKLERAAAIAGLLLTLVSSQTANTAPAVKNTWRGITPLRSSAEDVARLIGSEPAPAEVAIAGPFKVEGGEVTFSYLTSSLAKIYRAPRSMVGKVFTIYFKPAEAMSLTDLTLAAGFKRCAEAQDRTFYYFVNDAGVAYRLLRAGDRLDVIIYQPSRAEIRGLAVSTECAF